MPIQIGQNPGHDFTEPLGLLSDCHRRIERFLSVLARVTAGLGGGELTADHRHALTAALQYFREAAPKHTDDEEQSLFPRLRALASEEAQRALDEVDALEADHDRADRLHAEAEDLGVAWLRDGTLPAGAAARLLAITEELTALYTAHIQTEDTHLFPLARRVLTVEDQQAIGREMAQRRSVRSSAG
jgi:hemerythrin-like domain-containing protein